MISENNLTGTFPNVFVGMVNLENFELYRNQFKRMSLLMNGMDFVRIPPWRKL
jgi:hypothetical protein